jgi:hypothetical protein
MPGFIGGGGGGGGAGGEISFPIEFIDPVTKLRVSEPSNLIDTDFEYGLQPTKWETVELINNTPSFFSKSGDTTIQNISSITTLTGSREITVRTSLEHGLAAGIPISVSGTKSLTADGSYIISSVPNTRTFTYLAREVQFQTSSIEDLYTSIITGEFFQGSQIRISDSAGITTNGQPNSTLTVRTDTPHGFGPNTPFYFLNLNSSITLEFDSTNTESKSFDSSNSASARTFDGSNTTNFQRINLGNFAASAPVFSSVTGVNTTADTITVLHGSENFSGRPLGTPLQYEFSAVDGYFSVNPRGVVYLKTINQLGTGSSTFQVSAIPDGDPIDLTGNITGSIQVADLATTFAGNNLDPVNQITVNLFADAQIEFDGDNSEGQTFTVSAFAGASGIITFTAATSWVQGQMILYSTTGVAASNLINNTTYWVSAVNITTNQINITDSPGNIGVSNVLNISGGSGTQTFRSISVSTDKDIISIPGHNFQEADMVRYRYPAGGRFGSAEVFDHYYVERAFDSRNIALTRTKGFVLDGSTEAKAATSAAAIRIVNPSATDGAYWIRPAGSTVAYQTWCNFSLEGGNWMQLMKLSTSTLQTNSLPPGTANQPAIGAGNTFGPQWDGWLWNTDAQFATLFTQSTNANFNDIDSFSPLFYRLPFNDVMIVSINQVSSRLGWRHNSTIPNMRAVTGATSASTYGDSWLFPTLATDEYSWVRRLQTVAGVSQLQVQTPVLFGFKTLGDRANNYGNVSQFITGGYSTDNSAGVNGTTLSMIGIGGTGFTASRWGGGIGMTFVSNSQWRAHGNWAGSGTTSGGVNNRTFTGLAVFVR